MLLTKRACRFEVTFFSKEFGVRERKVEGNYGWLAKLSCDGITLGLPGSLPPALFTPESLITVLSQSQQ
jgi:hypothetical protein